MRELMLTAAVKASDFETACAILQGLTWMAPRRTIYRVLFFAGQPQPKGLPNKRTFQMSKMAPLWSELHQQLLRSSHIIQIAYEVLPENDFGKGTEMQFASLPGTLRWTNFPDPWRDTPVISRRKIEIPGQQHLTMAMLDNKHTYTNEMIQESHSFVRGDVEFILSRYYHLPESTGRPIQTLPSWEDLRPVDPAQKWVLNVKLNIVEDNPEKSKRALDEILAVKAELDELFDFKMIDRRVLDTRIAPPPVIPGRGPQ
ncbi:mediator complex, subunit Med18 [Xylariaceae sp. FL0016]|nr:mediator complex, subunit Med18 [Xylariaceae sp. FL0016]